MTPAHDEDDYRIVIFTQLKDPRELGRVFSEKLDMHVVDADLWAHHVPGVLNESFSEEQARELAAAIGALGIQVAAIRRSQIPDLRRAVPAHHVRCEEHGLQVIDMHGKQETVIPWAAVEMVCVGELPLDIARHHAPDMWNGVLGRNSSHDQSKDPLATGWEVLVTCRHPYPNLKIEHDRMNYEYLGSRHTGSSESNFRHLVSDLTGSATQALVSESTQSYLQHNHPGKHHFKNQHELIHYATLSALLARESVDGHAKALS